MQKTTHDPIGVATDSPQTNASIAIVFPHNNYRNLVMADYIANEGSLYYKVVEQDNESGAFTTHLLDALADQGLTPKKVKASGNAFEAGRAVGAALGNNHTLVLDEFDHLTEIAGDWLRGLADTVSSSSRVIINTRRIDHEALNPLLVEDKAIVLSEDSLSAASILDGQSERLTVHALGIGRVWFEGKEVAQWDGPLTRRLFYYLLDRGPVSRNQIFGTFWPNLPVREATNVFHVTKRKMNETIGKDVTDYTERHYRIAEHIRLHYDVTIFEDALKEADHAYGDESIPGWERAIKVYRHSFLMQETTPWVIERRKELREGYAQALISMARVHQKYHQNEQSLNHYLRALIEVPMREDLHLQVMKLHIENDDKAAAMQQYELLKYRLQNTLGISPGKEATGLYQKLSKA